MKILALQRESHVARGVPSLSVAARITEVLDYLQSIGSVTYTAISENEDFTLGGINWADVVILSKHSSPKAVELARYARKCGKRIIYDIDDWIFSFPQYSGAKSNSNKLDLIYEIIDLSDVVTVANQTLMHKVRAVLPKSLVVLVPNGMWVEKYVELGRTPDLEAYPPRIVFANADLLKMQSAKDMLLTALQIFFMRHPEFVLDFYGDPFPEMFSLPFLHFTNRMPYEDYMRALVSGRYQFAITPLGSIEDPAAAEFNACKNPFKYMNYGAAQVPGIYSRAPIYMNCITDGETGLLINNDFQSWIDALERLAFNSHLRQSIRAAALSDVIKNHHIRSSAEELMKVLSCGYENYCFRR